MKIVILCIFLLLGITTINNAQTINQDDLIISSIISDNFLGRYNLGAEYFLNKKSKSSDNSKFSIGINGGLYNTRFINQNIEGVNIIIESNWYTELTLSRKWNEYGGLKLSYGNLNNKSANEQKQSYFIGITTGVQPIILKKIALKINSDIGYIKNGLNSFSLLNSSNEVYYSGFSINFNVGIGVRF